MSWDYRVGVNEDHTEFRLLEVYYDMGDCIERYSWCYAFEPHGDTIEELMSDMEHQMGALDRPMMLIGENDMLTELDYIPTEGADNG